MPSPAPGVVPVAVYFACLGLGFIGVEIILVQKRMVFLGGPVYSMAVTRFALLVFCGLGRFAAQRLTRTRPRAIGMLILLAVGGALYAVALLALTPRPRSIETLGPQPAGASTAS